MSSPYTVYSQVDLSTLASVYTYDTSLSPEMESTPEDMASRPMNLKILYSFDDENKTNCLARWPHLLNVRTAEVEDGSRVGVVHLKTCIEAIVQASPELVAQLGQDYTVYAYDYSEYETPLVGQGMLSWALASISPTPDAPALESQTFVTGRVTRNALGLFNKGSQETLEVKLKLVPVPKVLQNEYLANMHKYYDATGAVGTHIDGEALDKFVQSNPTFVNPSRPPLQRTFSTSSERPGIVGESLQQGRSGSYSPPDTTALHPLYSPDQPFQSEGSRASTPVLNPGQAAVAPRRGSVSRPNSRASNRGTPQPQFQALPQPQPQSRVPLKRSTSLAAEYQSGDEMPEVEGGPGKKRARVVKASWPGATPFQREPESLRTAATNAASVRTIFQPIAMKPGNTPASNLEEPVRPPTPIAKKTGNPRRQSRPAPSSLRRQSLSQEGDQRFDSGQAHSKSCDAGGSAVSPGSIAGSVHTPPNIPSSPPVFDGMTSAPTTPQLPPLRKDDHDSGFMSGEPDSFFDDTDFPVLQDDWDYSTLHTDGPGETRESAATMTGPKQKQTLFYTQMPGDPSQLPHTIIPRTFDHRTKRKIKPPPPDLSSIPPSDMLSEQPHSQTSPPGPLFYPPGMEPPLSQTGHHEGLPLGTRFLPHTSSQSPPPQITISSGSRPNSRPNSRPPSRAGAKAKMPPPNPAGKESNRPLARTQSLSALPFANVPASDPVPPPLQRSQTIGEELQHPASDAPVPSKDKSRAGSGARRTAQIKNRLEASIEKGEVPPFCENCGAIETPTWRKVSAKYYSIGYEDFMESEKEEGFLLAEPLSNDDQGKVTSFRVIRKQLLLPAQEREQGYEIMNLCNPCGLWLFKNKTMRPEKFWNKEPRDPSQKRKRPPRSRSKKKKEEETNGPESQLNLDSAAITDGSSPEVPYGTDGGDMADEEYEDDVAEMPAAKRPQVSNENNSSTSSSLSQNSGYSIGSLDSKEAREAAMQKLLQKSPARHLAERTLIQADESVSPSTRRQLFPSPRKNNETKTLDGPTISISPTLRRSPQSAPQKHVNSFTTPSHRATSRDKSDSDASQRRSESPTALRRSPRINKQNSISETGDPKPAENDTNPVTENSSDQDTDDGLDELFESPDDDDDPPAPTTPTTSRLRSASAHPPKIPAPVSRSTSADAPTTPAPKPRSNQRNALETPSPATQAANLTVTPGLGFNTHHIKHVMKLMHEREEGSRDLDTSKEIQAMLAQSPPLSPQTSVFAELVRTVCENDVDPCAPKKQSASGQTSVTRAPTSGAGQFNMNEKPTNRHTFDTYMNGSELVNGEATNGQGITNGVSSDDDFYDLDGLVDHENEEDRWRDDEDEQRYIARLLGHA